MSICRAVRGEGSELGILARTQTNKNGSTFAPHKANKTYWQHCY